MEHPCEFKGIPYPLPTDAVDALPYITKDNQCAKKVRDRYIELQQWVRGRAS